MARAAVGVYFLNDVLVNSGLFVTIFSFSEVLSRWLKCCTVYRSSLGATIYSTFLNLISRADSLIRRLSKVQNNTDCAFKRRCLNEIANIRRFLPECTKYWEEPMQNSLTSHATKKKKP